ncbi:hypothetical protein [Chryseobacterium viscerum]|uniref:Uncharacterized protein n=1 Tax=Chryseobacterium viscerum TaxID=1037377 RepID=A0A316WUT0_9FLAO|nr:hypothetical protein [Chryseobacterium viscerum]KAB1231345.1 hypothetical protein F8D52_05935 [Chryseobacterium viscerum]PWN64226.1 hypothetical protein C1634_006420 [Chryseobacterium viscerum]
MKEVKELLDFLFKKEQEAIYLGEKKGEFDNYNQLAEEIKSYMNDITVGLGLPVLTSPKPDIFYEDNPSYPASRHLFKISEYNNEKYNTVWACYVSIPNPSASTKKLTNCFLVAEIDQSLKIIAKMGVEPDTRKWKFYGGDEDNGLRIHNLGTPVKVERYLEPTDEWSLEEYLKDK